MLLLVLDPAHNSPILFVQGIVEARLVVEAARADWDCTVGNHVEIEDSVDTVAGVVGTGAEDTAGTLG